MLHITYYMFHRDRKHFAFFKRGRRPDVQTKQGDERLDVFYVLQFLFIHKNRFHINDTIKFEYLRLLWPRADA